VSWRKVLAFSWATTAALLCCNSSPLAQTAYRYKDANGQWIYTDKAPPTAAHDDSIKLGHQDESLKTTVERTDSGTTTRLTAINDCLCVVTFTARVLHSDDPKIDTSTLYTKILQPGTREVLVTIENAGASNKNLEYRWIFALGSPTSQHHPNRPYRVPFAVGSTYVISQAFPDAITHNTPDSMYAVDIAVPDGTQIYAARDGTVINVRHDGFRGGLSPAMMDQANVVEILHDDGTIAIYAHLHWDSIRVRIGEHVDRGEYIANSGSTGFSSGPHLHFCVQRNGGTLPVAVPFEFAGPSDLPVTPQSHKSLTAY
jgi:murein DD-endopeptidase MepM/ murein hydrolase activator NlpD